MDTVVAGDRHQLFDGQLSPNKALDINGNNSTADGVLKTITTTTSSTADDRVVIAEIMDRMKDQCEHIVKPAVAVTVAVGDDLLATPRSPGLAVEYVLPTDDDNDDEYPEDDRRRRFSRSYSDAYETSAGSGVGLERVDDSEADIEDNGRDDSRVDAIIDQIVGGGGGEEDKRSPTGAVPALTDSEHFADAPQQPPVKAKPKRAANHRKNGHKGGPKPRSDGQPSAPTTPRPQAPPAQPHPQRKDLRARTEKWGESVGLFDAETGAVRRVLALNELRNYLRLEFKGQRRCESKVYCSLINDRFPRFFGSTYDYNQRWRMRYNIFADSVLADASDQSVVHIGELHLYFDLMPEYPNPRYVNNSFYPNDKQPERPLDGDGMRVVAAALSEMRRAGIFQLLFPIRAQRFRNTDHLYDKFAERQQEMLDESRSVHRKGTVKAAGHYSGGGAPSVGGSRGRGRGGGGGRDRDNSGNGSFDRSFGRGGGGGGRGGHGGRDGAHGSGGSFRGGLRRRSPTDRRYQSSPSTGGREYHSQYEPKHETNYGQNRRPSYSAGGRGSGGGGNFGHRDRYTATVMGDSLDQSSHGRQRHLSGGSSTGGQSNERTFAPRGGGGGRRVFGDSDSRGGGGRGRGRGNRPYDSYRNHNQRDNSEDTDREPPQQSRPRPIMNSNGGQSGGGYRGGGGGARRGDRQHSDRYNNPSVANIGSSAARNHSDDDDDHDVMFEDTRERYERNAAKNIYANGGGGGGSGPSAPMGSTLAPNRFQDNNKYGNNSGVGLRMDGTNRMDTNRDTMDSGVRGGLNTGLNYNRQMDAVFTDQHRRPSVLANSTAANNNTDYSAFRSHQFVATSGGGSLAGNGVGGSHTMMGAFDGGHRAVHSGNTMLPIAGLSPYAFPPMVAHHSAYDSLN